MEPSYMLRHFLAALKYRASKAILNARDNFPNFEAGTGVRSPVEILHHISHVLRCAQSVFDQKVHLGIEQKCWHEEVTQFYQELETLNRCLSMGLPERERIFEKLLQGPLSDAMTHVGQLAMLRRMSGDPIPGESFFEAPIRL